MGTSRQLPNTIFGRQKALTTAKIKKDAALTRSENILSDETSARLDMGEAAYKTGRAAITIAQAAYHTAVENARPQRMLLRTFISNYFERINYHIKNGKMLAAVRAYYELGVTNKRIPKLTSDALMLAAAAMVLSGDILRMNAVGIEMTEPTIAEFTAILDTAKPCIVAVSTAETALNTAIENLKKQIPEIRDLLQHVWDEVDMHYSLSTAIARRGFGRLWGMRFMSTGLPSVVTGTCKDEFGVPMGGIKVRIMGSSHSTISDELGNFSLNTSLYDDLELVATYGNYEDNITDFFKEDGIATAVDVVMEKKVV